MTDTPTTDLTDVGDRLAWIIEKLTEVAEHLAKVIAEQQAPAITAEATTTADTPSEEHGEPVEDPSEYRYECGEHGEPLDPRMVRIELREDVLLPLRVWEAFSDAEQLLADAHRRHSDATPRWRRELEGIYSDNLFEAAVELHEARQAVAAAEAEYREAEDEIERWTVAYRAQPETEPRAINR